MSILAPAQLSLHAYSPVWTDNAYVGDYTDDCTAYTHTLLSMGGMWSATLTLRQPRARAEEWLDRGLGRHIEVRALASGEIFSGFVNGVEASLSGYRRAVGPYLDIANRVRLIYSYVDTSAATPITGLRLSTDWLEDLDSSEKWGVRARVFSAGGIAASQVESILAMLLERYKHPPRSEEISLPSAASAGVVEVKLTLAGYAQTLAGQDYNNSDTDLVAASTKITDILTAGEDSAIARDYAAITRNAYQVSSYEADNASAWDLIKGIAAEGDDRLNRWTFGVYGGRRAYYQPVSNEVSYIRPLGEGLASVQNAGGQFLRAWEVLPGRYVGVQGLVPGRPLSSNLEADNRVLFAESVQFSAPDGLTINGAHAFRIERKLAQMGLSGIS